MIFLLFYHRELLFHCIIVDNIEAFGVPTVAKITGAFLALKVDGDTLTVSEGIAIDIDIFGNIYSGQVVRIGERVG